MNALAEQLIYSIRETIAESLSQIDVNDSEQLHDTIEMMARDIVKMIMKPIQ